jgi:hypothetical protein
MPQGAQGQAATPTNPAMGQGCRAMLGPGPPKTDAGRRTVTLPAVAAVALAEHLGCTPSRARTGW